MMYFGIEDSDYDQVKERIARVTRRIKRLEEKAKQEEKSLEREKKLSNLLEKPWWKIW